MSASLAIQLLAAAAEGDRHKVATLLYQGADTSYAQAGDRAGLTPLHVAAENGHTDVVRMLLDHGGNSYIDAKDQNGHTALHNAAAVGHVVTAKLLLNNGARHDIRDKQGNTPIHLAAMADQEQLISSLKGSHHGMSANHTGDPHTRETVDTVRALLHFGANPETKNKAGKTPQELTHSHQVKVLLERDIRIAAQQETLNRALEPAHR